MSGHVRSADTSTSVAYSRGELERILLRYGCTRSGHDTDREAQRIAVWFTVPDSKLGGGEFVPVRIEIALADVRARLNATAKTGVSPEQVERVAWRHVVLLVEAGLCAAEAGVKRVSEFFLADTVVRDDEGRPVRLIEALDRTLASGGGNWRHLLTSGQP